MPDDTRNLRLDPTSPAAPILEPQPEPAEGAGDLLITHAIHPVATPVESARAPSLDARPSNAPIYISVQVKFALALAIGVGWLAFSAAVAMPWIDSLAAIA